MDAPPPQENCLPFVTIAGYLQAMRLHAPRVIEADLDNGFLLLSDLGEQQYLSVLQDDNDTKQALYSDAISALLRLQQRGVVFQEQLPPYDEKLLRFELSLFKDWLCGKHLQFEFSNEEQHAWQACCDILVENALSQPQVFVHRDYHSRNLMFGETANPGILDFQDAVEGPLTYDLVSLLKDCYITWPPEQVREWALQFYAGCSDAVRQTVDERQFKRHFELMGLQRHIKAAGIFCRLKHRDGKSAYLDDVPRTLAYVSELDSEYSELEFLFELVARVERQWSETP